jgi:hypothetical protein
MGAVHPPWFIMTVETEDLAPAHHQWVLRIIIKNTHPQKLRISSGMGIMAGGALNCIKNVQVGMRIPPERGYGCGTIHRLGRRDQGRSRIYQLFILKG